MPIIHSPNEYRYALQATVNSLRDYALDKDLRGSSGSRKRGAGGRADNWDALAMSVKSAVECLSSGAIALSSMTIEATRKKVWHRLVASYSRALDANLLYLSMVIPRQSTA